MTYLLSFSTSHLVLIVSLFGLATVGGDTLRCNAVQTAQVATGQEGVPTQQWCCCGGCCGWAVNCGAIPGCSSC